MGSLGTPGQQEYIVSCDALFDVKAYQFGVIMSLYLVCLYH